jgi:hypothetical protein
LAFFPKVASKILLGNPALKKARRVLESPACPTFVLQYLLQK